MIILYSWVDLIYSFSITIFDLELSLNLIFLILFLLCRAIRRLDELMNNLQAAAEVVGDKHLADLFEASRETLRRGLPFAASLYI